MSVLVNIGAVWLAINIGFVAIMANRARYRDGISIHSAYREKEFTHE